ncbi:MAG: hypothetical protein ACK41W_07795 [Cyanobacteriota bacterium]|jgi:hypothetical protein
MDPITLIITALVQGAAKIVFQEHASDPQTYEAPLRKQLEQAALAEDPQVLALARQLLEQLGAPAAPAIEIGRGAKGIIGQTVTNATIVGDIH